MADISMSFSAVSGLKDTAANLQSSFDEFLRNFDFMTGEIMSNWEGIGRNNFESKCESMRPELEKISGTLAKTSKEIGNVVDKQEQTELASAATIAQKAFGGF